MTGDPDSLPGAASRGAEATDEEEISSVGERFLREAASTLPAEPGLDIVGRMFAGRYRVVSRLGAGGMGIVLLAEDVRLRRRVALKVLPTRLAGDDDRRRRLVREARAASKVTHAHIAAMYDAGESEGDIFLAMELVEGETLRARLAHARPPLAEAMAIGIAIAEGLGAAHAVGIVHRDIKPENVMIGAGGIVKVLDFGLAKSTGLGAQGASLSRADTATVAATEEGRILGTPAYMSPEQVKGLAVDARSDVFSLGIVLYELFTGERPFRGNTPMEVLIAIDRDAPLPIGALAPDVPAAVVAIVARCLEKEPASRLSSGAEVAAALRSAGRAPTGARAPALRRRMLVGAVGAAVLALLVTVAVTRARPSGAPPAVAMPIARVSPLAARGAVLACPILEAKGVTPPVEWFGAAAADTICTRAAAMLGGSYTHVLAPADLLDLPRTPTAALPDDPFAEPRARERTLAAAKVRASAYVDGTVVRAADSTRVTLVVRAADDRELGRAEGTGRVLPRAVARALDDLAARDVIPLASTMDQELLEVSLPRDPKLLTELADLDFVMNYDAELQGPCARFSKLAGVLGETPHASLMHICRDLGVDVPPGSWGPVDRTSLATYLSSLGLGNTRGHEKELLVETRERLAVAATPIARSALVTNEAELLAQLNEEKARAAAIQSVMLEPHSDNAWAILSNISQGPGGRPIMIAATTWRPSNARMWSALARSDPDPSSEKRLTAGRRAYELAPTRPSTVAAYATYLLEVGRRDDARAVAAGTRSDPGVREVGESVEVLVDASEAKLAAALDRARVALRRHVPLWLGRDGSLELLLVAREISIALGREREVGDEFVALFVDPEPIRLPASDVLAVANATITCAFASPPAAKRCLARLRRLLDENYFEYALPPAPALFAGAEAYVRGDLPSAANAWRPLARVPNLATSRAAALLSPVFDAIGEPDVAERLDTYGLAHPGELNGANTARVRAARRAAKRGDGERARKLAQEVVDAWSVADAPVPAVKEMRALLARLGR